MANTWLVVPLLLLVVPASCDKLPGWKGEVHRTKAHKVSEESRATELSPSFASLHREQPSAAAITSDTLIMTRRPAPSHHASTIVETAPGVFLAAWFGGTFEGKSDVSIYSSTFAVSEGAWTAPALVVPAHGVPTWNPVLHRVRGSGEVLLFYKVGAHPVSWRGFVKRSRDGGNTWQEAEALPEGVVGPAKNKCLEMEGELLCPSSVEGGKDGKTWVAWVEGTADGGRSWQRYGPIEYQGKIIQPTLWRGDDGRVRMLARTRATYTALAVADATGHTWAPVRLTKVPCPNSGLDAVKARDGSLYLVFNNSTLKGTAARAKLVLSVSRDDGETWRQNLVLEDTGSHANEFSYPAIIEAEDGNLHVTYTWKRLNIRHLVIDPDRA